MASERMPINKEVLRWARERAGYSQAEALQKFRQIVEWEATDSDSFPTYPQLEALAGAFKIPIAAFFLPTPPVLPPIEQTFRTLPETELDTLEPRIKLLLRKAKALQINLATLNGGRNPADRLITRDLRFSLSASAAQMAAEVRTYLDVSIVDQMEWPSPELALEKWRSKLADVGVFVFKDQFRNAKFAGFCLTDAEFPIIYVNNTSPKTRQIFTLFHELGHLLFHTSGIDLRFDDLPHRLVGDDARLEVLCNRFAAALLLPDNALFTELGPQEPSYEIARSISQRFNVSALVVFRRFLDHGLIDAATYTRAHEASAVEPPPTGGGNYYNNQMAYLGRAYIGMALREFYQNRISSTELAEILNVAPKSVSTLEERFLKGAA